MSLFERACVLNLIHPVQIGKEQVCLKALQFADDTLIFVPRNELVISNYFRILDVVAVMSGLSLNYSKPSFITWNSADHDWAQEVARSVGCLHSIIPFTYLGFPLGNNMNKSSAWKPLIEKIQLRLSSWKARLLSRAGKLTLIKSVLNSLPLYFLSLFKMPKLIAQKIVNIQRRFFWGESVGGKLSIPLIKWSSVELPKDLGGLGVGNIMYKNLILLFKWWWRFSKSDNTL